MSTRGRPSTRGWTGLGVTLAGTVLLFLGWYGVSGRATIGEQMPFIASGSIPGAALLVAGAVLVASDLSRHSNERAEAMIAQLHALLTEAVPTDAPAPAGAPAPIDGHGAVGVTRVAAADGLVVVSGTDRFHRATCALTEGRETRPLTRAEADDRRLVPCPVCEP